MLISLGVILVPLLALMAFCRPSATEDAPRADPAAVFRAARAANAFGVLVPAGLPSGWRATNATLRDDGSGARTLRVTYVTPSKAFAQLMETSRPAEAVLGEETKGQALGPEPIGGRTWQRYDGQREADHALVFLEPRATVLVTGDGSEAELTALAAALS
jgi:hypothetical protein